MSQGGRGSGRVRRTASRPVHRVEITSIAAGGEGVGRLEDGRVVFVHRTAPGELVDTELIRERPRWTRGRLLRVLRAAPDRREAPCPHYDECGGCTLEHLAYDAQLRAKSRIVADAFARIGGAPIEPPEVVPSAKEIRYRNRVSFALRRRGRGRVEAGFHALHRPDDIVPIDGRCLLFEEPIATVWDALRGAWGDDAGRLPSGERLRLTLRSSAAGAVSLLVEGGFSPGRPDELIAMTPGLTAIWHAPEGQDPEHLAGAPGLPEIWGEEVFELGGAAFLQVNRGAAERLEAHVLELVGPPAGLRVVDAYCGIGIHARRLARGGARVDGIELDPAAVAIASSDAPAGAHFHVGRVESLIQDLLPADLLIVNPPRAGLDPAVAEAIVHMPPPRVIYISCDPATLARDVGRLRSAFSVRRIRCFDLFPQTSHVETVLELQGES